VGQLLSIILCNLLWLYLDVMFQEQTNFKSCNYDYILGKWYYSMFCSMYVVTSVTMPSLTETVLMAKLFPFCCQVSKNCKNLYFPILCKFKKFYNGKLRNGINFALFQSIKPKHRESINNFLCLFLREVKNVCDNTYYT
jgi:hypothetical protein